MKVLVTGGQGYVGGRLCEFLSDQEMVEVSCASRKPSPSCNPRVRPVVSDWASDNSLMEMCSGVDAVVHLAAMNAADCAADPVGALSMNGVASVRLLEAASKSNVRRFVYLSTAHVYGSPLAGKITEDACPAPVHPYATSHRAAEDAILAVKGIEGIVLRLSNAFGAPTHSDVNCWDLLFNDLCRQVVTNGDLVLRSTGLQRRDFVPLSDVCRAILHVLELPTSGLSRRLYNLGGNWSPTVFEAASLIADRYHENFGVRPPITRAPPGEGEVPLPLDYSTDALRLTGFRLEADRIRELDGVLSFCLKTFGGRRD